MKLLLSVLSVVVLCITNSICVNAQSLKVEKEVTEFVCLNHKTISESFDDLAVIIIENTSRIESLEVIVSSQDGDKLITISRKGTESIVFSRYQQGKVTVTLWYSNDSCANVKVSFLTKK